MTDENSLREIEFRTIRRSDIAACPFSILRPDHYRADGSCKCSNAEHRAMMIREWGYTPEHFLDITLLVD